jgi:TRAP-type C4-dicarboxylate transport system permease small subunit
MSSPRSARVVTDEFCEPARSGRTGRQNTLTNRRVQASIGRALQIVERVLEDLAMVALVAVMLLIMVNGVLRKGFAMPIPGSVNITTFYLMPALVFLALPSVQGSMSHISADIVVRRLSPAGQALCRVLVALLVLPIALLMLYGALRELGHVWGTTLGGYPPLPVGPSWIFVTLGLTGMVLRVLWQLAGTQSATHSGHRNNSAESTGR